MAGRASKQSRSARSYSPLTGAGASMSGRGGGGSSNRLWVIGILGILVVVNLYYFLWKKDTSIGAVKDKAASLSVPSGPGLTGSGEPGATPTGGSGAAAPSDGGASNAAPAGAIDGKVQKGDTIGKLLKRNALAAPAADELIRSLAGVLDFKAIRVGQDFHLELAADGTVRRFELVLSKVQRIVVERNAAGQLVARDDKQASRIEVKELSGRIDSSLSAAIKASGEDTSLVAFFVDVFAYDIDFYNDTHEGDTFRVVVEKEVAEDGRFLRYQNILAAEYHGKAGTYRVFYWGPNDGGPGRYFDADGQSTEKTFLKTPLKFARMSSGFDRHRMHPVLHRVKAHLGIDYAAPVGTPVWAAANGTVSWKGPKGGAGNLVMIKHDGGLETAYMHLSKFAKDLKVGDRIAAKKVIGFVGATGLATGPHLHFGVKKNGEFVDPSTLAPVRKPGVAAAQKQAYLAVVSKLEARLQGIAEPPALVAKQEPTAASAASADADDATNGELPPVAVMPTAPRL